MKKGRIVSIEDLRNLEDKFDPEFVPEGVLEDIIKILERRGMQPWYREGLDLNEPLTICTVCGEIYSTKDKRHCAIVNDRFPCHYPGCAYAFVREHMDRTRNLDPEIIRINLLPPRIDIIDNVCLYYQSDKPLDIDSIDFSRRADELAPRGLLVTENPLGRDVPDRFLYEITVSGRALDLRKVRNMVHFEIISEKSIERVERYADENDIDIIYLHRELAVLRNRHCIREVVEY